jgi:hypothetical protein
MSRRMPWWIGLGALLLWVVLSYGVRYGLMESTQWQCQARSGLGMLVYLGVIGWTAVGLALLGFFLPRQPGRVLALLALVVGVPGLVLYSAGLSVFAVVIAGLRLVRG